MGLGCVLELLRREVGFEGLMGGYLRGVLRGGFYRVSKGVYRGF